MSAVTIEEAEALLHGEELAECLEGGIREMREMAQACLAAGIPASLSADACCGGGCSGPKAKLVVRSEDVPRVSELMRAHWQQMVESLGVTLPPAAAGDGNAEPPCPACGTAAPLVEGACSDCGLQLE